MDDDRRDAMVLICKSFSRAKGDWLLLRAGAKHRVAWTDPTIETVWLAVFYGGSSFDTGVETAPHG